MVKKIMLINAVNSEEVRIVTIRDGVLLSFDIDFIYSEKVKGNIYKAKVNRIDSNLQSAFINYGHGKMGFLPIGEMSKKASNQDDIHNILSCNQEIMVQVVREEVGNKYAMLTSKISIPGRYLVLVPGYLVSGVSRKIELEEERKYFKSILDQLIVPDGFGVIVRTASFGVTKEDFQCDLDYLLEMYQEIQISYAKYRGQGLVWQEDDIVTRTFRDIFTFDINEVYIDDVSMYNAAHLFFKRALPQFQHVLKFYSGSKSLFSKFQIEEQIDRICDRRVSLISGGAIIIEQTEALTSIDVNSERTGSITSDIAIKTNIEAVEEIAQQLKLRDLSGLIVIDFIDMNSEEENHYLIELLCNCLQADKAKTEVGTIDKFGILVMTRQKLRPLIQHSNFEPCRICQGTGKTKTLGSLVTSAMRRIKGYLSMERVASIMVKLTPSIAIALLNNKRDDLAKLEEIHDVSILVLADEQMPFDEMAIETECLEEFKKVKRESIDTENINSDIINKIDSDSYNEEQRVKFDDASSVVVDNDNIVTSNEAPIAIGEDQDTVGEILNSIPNEVFSLAQMHTFFNKQGDITNEQHGKYRGRTISKKDHTLKKDSLLLGDISASSRQTVMLVKKNDSSIKLIDDKQNKVVNDSDIQYNHKIKDNLAVVTKVVTKRKPRAKTVKKDSSDLVTSNESIKK